MAKEGYGDAAEAIRKCEAMLRDRGYDFSQSSLGDARYWSLPGNRVRIRLATYPHRHDATVDLTIRPCFAIGGHLNERELRDAVETAIRTAKRMEAVIIEAEEESNGMSSEEIAKLSPEEVQRLLRGD